MPSWSLATVQPGREITIARRLSSHEFPIFLPKVLVRVCCRGRVMDRVRSAFGRYLWLDPCQRFYELRTVFGVKDFIASGTIVDHAVNQLMAVAPDGFLPTPEIPCRFAPGDPVVVRGSGLLTGQRGVFDRMLQGDSAIILMDWFGRQVPIPVVLDDLLAEPRVESKPAKRKRRFRRRHRKGRNAATPDMRARA